MCNTVKKYSLQCELSVLPSLTPCPDISASSVDSDPIRISSCTADSYKTVYSFTYEIYFPLVYGNTNSIKIALNTKFTLATTVYSLDDVFSNTSVSSHLTSSALGFLDFFWSIPFSVRKKQS